MVLLKSECGTMKKKYNGVCVKTYFNRKQYLELIKDAEKSKIRRVGLLAFTQKKGGFAHEKVANTDYLAKFLKYCWKNWKETEDYRLRQKAEVLALEREIEEKKKKLRMG